MKKSTIVISLILAGIASADPGPEHEFAGMSPEEARAHELDVLQQVPRLSLLPPHINTNSLPEYGHDQFDYGMGIGSARTPRAGSGRAGAPR